MMNNADLPMEQALHQNETAAQNAEGSDVNLNLQTSALPEGCNVPVATND